MRYWFLLLTILGSVGCGTSAIDHDPFTLKPFSPPSITALQPASVPVNSVPFTMAVNGNNFGTDAVVFWKGSPLRTRFVNVNQVLADLKEDDLMFAGLVPVYVRTGGLNSNTVDFNVSIE